MTPKGNRDGSSSYIGGELELFENAVHWKRYWGSCISPYLEGDVLEVGAGLGGSTRELLGRSKVRSWDCLEPDPQLSKQIRERVADCAQVEKITVMTSYLDEIMQSKVESYDAVLYLDVIEHIEQDDEELMRARSVLKPGGFLIILVPAHKLLFSEFDQSIGHFRRYNRKRLSQALPLGMEIKKFRYLDCVGLAASLANKLLLKQSLPAKAQIEFWDRWMVRTSRILDPVCGFHLGKSLLCICEKERDFRK